MTKGTNRSLPHPAVLPQPSGHRPTTDRERFDDGSGQHGRCQIVSIKGSRRSARHTDRGRGQALVEFALVVPLFLLLVAGMIDFGMGLSSSITVTNAAREGARLGIINPNAIRHREPGPLDRPGPRPDQGHRHQLVQPAGRLDAVDLHPRHLAVG